MLRPPTFRTDLQSGEYNIFTILTTWQIPSQLSYQTIVNVGIQGVSDASVKIGDRFERTFPQEIMCNFPWA